VLRLEPPFARPTTALAVEDDPAALTRLETERFVWRTSVEGIHVSAYLLTIE